MPPKKDGEWPDWGKLEELVKEGKYVAGNNEFTAFKKKVLKATDEEIVQQVGHSPLMWDFLLGFAAIKKMYRSLLLQVFHRLMEVPSWVAAFEANPALRDKLRTLHEDLQAALGAQHQVLQMSISPEALKSIKEVKSTERPEEVKRHMAKERLVDKIKEETEDAAWDEAAASPSAGGSAAAIAEQDANHAEDQAEGPRRALQEGIDAASAIDDPAKMVAGGRSALDQLRLGCIMSAGMEDIFEQETGSAHQVFTFVLSYAKMSPSCVEKAAEVMNQLMASSSWAGIFESSRPLQDALRVLPLDAQVAFGLQHPKLLELISSEAHKKATGGDAPRSIQAVVDRMQSIRSPPAKGSEEEAAKRPAPKPPKNEWKEARTPEGHSYYYNLSTRESTWERPAALGGPRVYSVGQEVEVWSNGQRVWGRGKVEKVETGWVTAEFQLPNGASARKELPCAHRDLRPAAPMAAGWSDEEKEAYRRWFEVLPGGSETSKPGQAVASFLNRSGLQRPALKQLWHVAVSAGSRDLSFEDFARCCRLVAHCQAFGSTSSLVVAAERPLRVKLREESILLRPPALPRFQ